MGGDTCPCCLFYVYARNPLALVSKGVCKGRDQNFSLHFLASTKLGEHTLSFFPVSKVSKNRDKCKCPLNEYCTFVLSCL